MIVDTSALIAILIQEDDYEAFETALLQSDCPKIGAATLLEARMVASSLHVLDDLEAVIAMTPIRIEPLTAAIIDHAFHGFRTYGKGRHKAALNFGDCFAYGLARALDEPLLFKGDDFSRTDITPALA